MMVLQTLLMLSATLLLCSGARLTRQLDDKVRRLPGLDVCGVADVKVIPTKVVGGHPAKLGEFPWIAALGYTTKGSRGIGWNCAGSLITDQHVLTAAHCVHPDSISTKRTVTAIRLGEHDMNEAVRDGAQPIDIPVESVTIHKQYNGIQKTNDIAIIKMKSRVTFTKSIRPICLAPPEFETKNFTGYSPAIVGWGRTHANKPRDDTRLMKAEVKIHNTDACRRNVTSAPNLGDAIIDNRVICASSPGVDTCQGDSGGPLMLQRKLEISSQHNYFLMGIVSYGYSCAKEGYPGVYTRVAPFMGWIIDNMDI